MKKVISLFSFILLSHSSLFSQVTAKEKKELDYVVLLNNDTVYGEMGNEVFTAFATGGGAYNFTPKGGEKTKYSVNEAKALRIKGIYYEAKSKEPQFGTKGSKAFLKVMIRSGGYELFVFEEANQPGVIPHYYLFENDSYVDKVKKNNYEELLPKYFGGCPDIAEYLKSSKGYYRKMYGLSDVWYKSNCSKN